MCSSRNIFGNFRAKHLQFSEIERGKHFTILAVNIFSDAPSFLTLFTIWHEHSYLVSQNITVHVSPKKKNRKLHSLHWKCKLASSLRGRRTKGREGGRRGEARSLGAR